MSDRLFFIHIPKTAGTSLRRVVRGRYREHEFEPVYSHDPSSIEALKRKAPGLNILYGHFSFGFHDLLGVPGRYATVVREPVARVISLYAHQRNNPAAGFHREARSMPLRELLSGGAAHELNNHMTRIISGHPGTQPLDDDSALSQAKKNIEDHFVFVGLCERLQESLDRLARLMGWSDVSGLQRINVGSARTPTDPDTLGLIRSENRLDIELYDWICERFTRS